MTVAPPPSDEADDGSLDPERRLRIALLLGSTFLIALCSIVYELIIGTLSSYLLGSSVYWFSLTIGIYMSAMGLGSYLSRYVRSNLLESFFWVEIGVGTAGGTSAALLFAVFTFSSLFQPAMWTVTVVIGTLVGLEIPLLTRYIRQYAELRDAIADVMSWDYVGALAGSIAFPLLLLPTVGVLNSGALIGLINIAIAGVGVVVFRDEVTGFGRLAGAAGLVATLLVVLFFASGAYQRMLDQHLFEDDVIYREQTPYQKIVMTGWRDDRRLYLNGNLQFSSLDEHRYHESLVHPVMAAAVDPSDVLLLGAGDGLAVRELQKYPDLESVTVVDLDPAITRLARKHPVLRRLNENALDDDRVEIRHADAMNFLQKTDRTWDVVICDLPDPNNEDLVKLYSRSFYKLVHQHLRPDGAMVTQSTSPYYARRAFWSIHRTVESVFCGAEGCRESDGDVVPYHTWVPSFGDWGFNLAAKRPLHEQGWRVRVETRYLSDRLLPSMFVFPDDTAELDVEVNRLADPVLLGYYLEGWSENFQQGTSTPSVR